MELLSFVLVPHRRSCKGGMCRVLKELTFLNYRGNLEKVVIIALRCDYKSHISAIVNNIMHSYIQKPATKTNVETAAWSIWCTKLLTDDPDGRNIPEEMANIINSECEINAERFRMVYLPAAYSNWDIFKSSVRQHMSQQQRQILQQQLGVPNFLWTIMMDILSLNRHMR